MNEQKPVRLCGLWKNTSKDGKVYLSCNLGFGKLLIFPNSDKKNENGPDYTLMIAEKPQQQQAPQVAEDDIPF